MSSATPILMSWSAGKDSALALDALRTGGEFQVEALVTTVTDDFDRVSMHGVRRALLVAQADALGLPLVEVRIPRAASNEVYEAALVAALEPYIARGVRHVGFGDLFLRDIREYRERFLAGLGLHGVFPIWLRDTRALAEELVRRGFRAVAVCVDPRRLDGSFAGRWLDASFFADLPAGVDPCGENGEFHTFVVDGPGFRHAIDVELGAKVERDGFVFADLLERPKGVAA
jgi:uncharacterized protein (TIGR00290 family)